MHLPNAEVFITLSFMQCVEMKNENLTLACII